MLSGMQGYSIFSIPDLTAAYSVLLELLCLSQQKSQTRVEFRTRVRVAMA